MAEITQTAASGTVSLEDRKRLTASRVKSVGAATPTCVTCTTALGDMTVKGQELRILKFSEDDGILSVQGRIDSICYTAKRVKTPLIKRLWK